MKYKIEHKQQIAVLDADPAILKYIQRILADRYSVSLFTEPEELCQGLKEAMKLDMLMMDWDMHEEDTSEKALKLLTEIRALKPAPRRSPATSPSAWR